MFRWGSSPSVRYARSRGAEISSWTPSTQLSRNQILGTKLGEGIRPAHSYQAVYTLELARIPNSKGGAVEVAYFLGKFLAGGTVVVFFAVISETFQPKRFAWISSAAPSVLLASLIVTTLLKGTAPASLSASGAVAGATGLVAYALLIISKLSRLGIIRRG